ncbi:MAG TPA: PKD domain-containing protein [Candidatus Aminicenantes bacterium]|nr:PKD domain-containing protein [Candidatus Aminicenantes bacterium]HRY65517.1 PKD domain-containing protein [Candidatus Aminicenantes bacterium]HRZ72595.1 PKD domain-containing protein [Candidatus Aminicenantes bacterium]
MMKLRKSVLIFVVMALAVMTTLSFAQTTKLKRIGLYTFCTIKGQEPTPATMKGLFDAHAAEIKAGFDLAGNPELYEPFMEQMKTAEWVDTTMPVGEVLPWMLFKSHNQVKVARNVEWAGKAPAPVFIVPVTKDWKRYEFVIPKGCGNIALSNKVTDLIQPAVCSLSVTPARVNANDPITVDMSGSQNAKSMIVEVSDAQGNRLATQELTPQSPKWQTKFDKPGEYTFKGSAVGLDGKASACAAAVKTAVNFPPICKLWTSCMPCEDYVGRPITFDASGSSDPDGQIVKVVFELLDSNGNVIDTCVTTRKPWTWEKVFTKAGTYTINTTVFDNDGAQSPASDPCRLTFEVTQKKLFWSVGAGLGLFAGGKFEDGQTVTGTTQALYGFLRAGLFAWLTPDKWSFTLTGGGSMPFKGDPWKFAFTGDALINGHFQSFFLGTGVGVSSATQAKDDNHKFGLDIPIQAGFKVFDNWKNFGQLFFEFRLPIGRSFDHNWKSGVGFRFLF